MHGRTSGPRRERGELAQLAGQLESWLLLELDVDDDTARVLGRAAPDDMTCHAVAALCCARLLRAASESGDDHVQHHVQALVSVIDFAIEGILGVPALGENDATRTIRDIRATLIDLASAR